MFQNVRHYVPPIKISFPSSLTVLCAAIDENFVFLRGFFREELCLPDQSCSCSSRLRKAYVAANPALGRAKA